MSYQSFPGNVGFEKRVDLDGDTYFNGPILSKRNAPYIAPDYLISVGNYVPNNYPGGAVRSSLVTASSLSLTPLINSFKFSSDTIAVPVATGTLGALARLVIYNHNYTNHLPSELLYQSGDIDLSISGIITSTISFTFDAGRQYWVGLFTNAVAPTLETYTVGGLLPSTIPTLTITGVPGISLGGLTYPTAPSTAVNAVNSLTAPSLAFRISGL